MRLTIFVIILLSFFGFSQQELNALPTCHIDDLIARNQSYEDWQITVLDTIFLLDDDYAPTDLVELSEIGLNTKIKVREFVLADLSRLLSDAKDAGNPLDIQSAYRSYAYQKSTFNYWVDTVGEQEALLTSARAGHSEHQLGTTVDFKSLADKPAWEYKDWATTKAGKWLKEHAHLYGFVMSYPKDKKSETCYSYEPWHYRYIGIDYATAAYNSGLTPREWLWSLQDYLKKD